MEIRKEIQKEVILKFPNFKKKFSIESDASKTGCGAMLYQEDGILGYFSKKFTSSEQNYSIVEKELYGVVSAMKFFKGIIQGYYTEIFTDNRNCTFENKGFSSRIERWKILLNDFNFKIISIRGIENQLGDSLSRVCGSRSIIDVKRQKYLEIIERCKEDRIDETLESSKIRLKEDSEELFLEFIHKISEHTGVIVMYNNLKKHFTIKDVVKKLNRITKFCEMCKKNKSYNPHSKLQNLKMGSSKMFERVSTDIFGPFKLEEYETDQEYETGFFITMVDIYSKISYVRFSFIANTKEIIKTVNPLSAELPEVKRASWSAHSARGISPWTAYFLRKSRRCRR